LLHFFDQENKVTDDFSILNTWKIFQANAFYIFFS